MDTITDYTAVAEKVLEGSDVLVDERRQRGARSPMPVIPLPSEVSSFLLTSILNNPPPDPGFTYFTSIRLILECNCSIFKHQTSDMNFIAISFILNLY